MMFLTPVTGQDQKNPLLQKWTTPYETPPFDQIKNEYFKPAVLFAIKEAKKEIDGIAKNKEKPGFDNTIVALDRSGSLLRRVTGVFFNLNECNTNVEMQKIALEISPELDDFNSYRNTNEKLFERVKTIYSQKESLPLTPEQKTLLENTYKSFVRGGALLSKDDKKKFLAISKQLSVLSLKFKQNVLADNNAWQLHITEPTKLKGLPKALVEMAEERAKSKGLEGWLFTLDAPFYVPFMQYSFHRDLREQMWKAYNNRGNRENENNNNEIVINIANLRLQLANLLGYKRYSDYILSERMAETTENVNKFLDDILKVSFQYAQKELFAVQNYVNNEGANFTLERWDWSYFSERLKEKKFSIRQQEIKEYFEVESVRKGIFQLFEKLYGLSFQERKDIPVYHPDVRAFEVVDGKKRFMGVLYLDLFTRESKRGGAWVVSFRKQKKENGADIRPVLQVVCNYAKPSKEIPSLLTFDELTTFLHEFGHAIHTLLSDVNYESLSCTSVYRDFVELPSQVMENWATQKEFLDLFAVHYRNGRKLPEEYIQKIIASQQYNAGYLTVRQLSFGMLDMAWHSITQPVTATVADFERQAIEKTELFPPVKGAVLSTSFSHIFSGGYAAGYYGYKWAEVLDADVFSLFLKEGVFNRAAAEKFRESVLSKGGTEHPMKLYKDFMNREPDNAPFFNRSGFEK